MDDFKSDTAKIIQTIIIGIGVLLITGAVLFGIFGVPYMIASNNNAKVQNLTNSCIEKGFDGWRDGWIDDDRDTAISACYNDK